MYGLSHRKYTADTLRPVEGMLANGETVKVQASKENQVPSGH
jgi:hypothetical protein